MAAANRVRDRKQHPPAAIRSAGWFGVPTAKPRPIRPEDSRPNLSGMWCCIIGDVLAWNRPWPHFAKCGRLIANPRPNCHARRTMRVSDRHRSRAHARCLADQSRTSSSEARRWVPIRSARLVGAAVACSAASIVAGGAGKLVRVPRREGDDRARSHEGTESNRGRRCPPGTIRVAIDTKCAHEFQDAITSRLPVSGAIPTPPYTQ